MHDHDRLLIASSLIRDARLGLVTRRQFLARAAAVGLSMGTVGSVLAACGSENATTPASGGASAAPASGAVADIARIVYPEGITSDRTYKGPHGGDRVAFLPPDAHGDKDADGIWTWDFADFQADRRYKLAFAHFSSAWDLSVEMTKRFERFAEKIGVDMDIYDNNFDAEKAISNADLMVQRKYDLVIEAQIFPDANQTIQRKLAAAGTKMNYLAVGPTEITEDSLFTDPGNFRMCSALGEWLGDYAQQEWGGEVDLVILAAQPRAGEYVGQREVGYLAGLESKVGALPAAKVVTIDSQGLLENAQKLAADVLTKNPDATNIIGCGTNDDAGVGIVRALEAAGRDGSAAVAGQAGQASAVAELSKPSSAFKVSAFQDNEAWTWMAATGVLWLMGGEVAPANFIPYYLTTKDDVADFPAQAGALS
jgi:ABC-type sugar transport system substrate-binding protein